MRIDTDYPPAMFRNGWTRPPDLDTGTETQIEFLNHSVLNTTAGASTGTGK